MRDSSVIGYLALAFLSAASPCAADDGALFSKALGAISSDRMLGDVTQLSDRSFRGRQSGTPDDQRSAEWVGGAFERLGLTLLPTQGNGLASNDPRPADIRVHTIVDPVTLEVSFSDRTFTSRLGDTYLPVLDSPSADIAAPVVFVGYGISDAEHGFDEYAPVDVKNRVVLFLRGKPDKYPGTVSHAEKERFARERGAIGYLTATGPVRSRYEQRRGVTGAPAAYYGHTDDPAAVPGAWISTEFATRLIRAGGKGRLDELQSTINGNLTPQSHLTSVNVRMSWTSKTTPGTFHNVVASLPGTDDRLAQDTIVIGAHRDHFGHQAGLLFPGADDNASGTAVLLELARVLSQPDMPHRRSLLFVSFSGEEQGLLGSKLFVRQSLVPLDSIKAMINIDHAGIGDGRLIVGVTGIEKSFVDQAGQTAGLSEKLDVFGYFPGGDHVPFKEAGIPTVTVVSGGTHPHFHQPSDTADTINPKILETVARFVSALTWRLANND